MIYFSKKKNKTIFFKIKKTGKLGPKTETERYIYIYIYIRLNLFRSFLCWEDFPDIRSSRTDGCALAEHEDTCGTSEACGAKRPRSSAHSASAPRTRCLTHDAGCFHKVCDFHRHHNYDFYPRR